MTEAGAPEPGRVCPASYRTPPSLFDRPVAAFDTLWVAGGAYGNLQAVRRLESLFAADLNGGTRGLVFNGDFHWFDADPAGFDAVDDVVAHHLSTRGNVETELVSPDAGAGCGCGYPSWVGDAEVARSNRIITRLQAVAAALPARCSRLAALPAVMAADVGGIRVAIVHGDADSIAGWGFSQEVLATPDGLHCARAAFDRIGARVIASSHSCLPVLQGFGADRAGGPERVLVNNGAAGMPNFQGTRYGLATRISVRPYPQAVYGARCGELHVQAVAIDYDDRSWRAEFMRIWPKGSDAFLSYARRLRDGPPYRLEQAMRAGERLPAAA